MKSPSCSHILPVIMLLMLTAVVIEPAFSCSQALAKQTDLTPGDGLPALGAALKNAKPGDVFHLLPGVYPGSLKIGRLAGTPETPIIIEGEPGTILGGDPKRWEGSILEIGKSSHILLRGLEIVGGQRGVTLGGCSNIAIEDCHIHDMSNYAIMSYKSSGVSIRRNLIERSAKEHGIYVSAAGENIEIADNLIRLTHINGVHVNGKIRDVRILRNVFDRTGTYPSPEGGSSVTFVGGAHDGLIANNLFLDTYGQCVTDGGAGLRILNNVFEGYSWSVLLAIGQASETIFSANIVLPGKAVPLQISAKPLETFSSDYNYFAASGGVFSDKHRGELSFEKWRELGQDVHSSQGSPPFADNDEKATLLEKYHLASDGPAVDAGPENLEDAVIPPGLGAPRADQGLFGGPGNAWRLD